VVRPFYLNRPECPHTLTGGNVNVTDNDGDTPLYTVENVQTARFLVENGAIVARQNLEGVSVRSISPFLLATWPFR